MSTTSSPGRTPALAPDMSVNELLQRWPASVRALDALGVDSCCGGAASLEEAAADVGVPVSTLIDAIERELAAEGAR